MPLLFLWRNHSIWCWESRDMCEQRLGCSMWPQGKFQMVTIFLVSTFWRQFLQAMVDESPNKHLPLVPAQTNHVYFLKSTLNMTKLGTLGALGGQDRSPKNFKYGWGLSFGLDWSPQKERMRFGWFWTSQWAYEKSIFSPVVHRDSRPPGAQISTSLTIFCWFQPLRTNFFLNFWKIIIW